MKNSLKVLFLSAAVTIGPAWLPVSAQDTGNCTAPQAPSIPDGRRSREAEMQETYQAVQDYLAASEQYRQCLQALVANHGEEAEKSKAMTIINEMINESLEVEQLVADTFNRELRAFKANQKR